MFLKEISQSQFKILYKVLKIRMKSKKKISSIAKAIDEAVFDNIATKEVTEENEETQAKVVVNEEEDDIFDQDFSRQEKPSKLRILNESKLDKDEKYQGKKISRKSLRSFGDSDSDDSDENGSDSEDTDDEADDGKEHAGAELGHMFEMEGVEYSEEDEPALRTKRRFKQPNLFGEATEESALSNASDLESDISEASSDNQGENDLENEDEDGSEEDDDSEEEDEDVERIKNMILKSKVQDGSGGEDHIGSESGSDDDGTDENSESPDSSGDEHDNEDDMGFDLSAVETQSKLDHEDAFDTFKPVNVDNEISKGNAIKSQLKLWDGMLELRIALQKSLVKTNQLPQNNHWHIFKSGIDDNESDTIKQCQKNLAKVLDSLIELRNLLLQGQTSVSTESVKELPRKRKVADYEKDLEQIPIITKKWKHEVLEDWNDRTRVAGKKNDFAGFETSVTRQINHILGDKARLVKRTQLKRSACGILGQGQASSTQDGDYNEEIFDDDDFYHQLLRELIERKTSDVTDPIALGQQWLQLQKLRAKVKKKVDTKASKGRKTRYDIHAKLVNFMAATYPRTNITEEAKNELFASLFRDQLKK